MIRRDVYVCYGALEKITTQSGTALVSQKDIAIDFRPTEAFVIYRPHEKRPNLFCLTRFIDERQGSGTEHNQTILESAFESAKPYSIDELAVYLDSDLDTKRQPLTCHTVLTTEDLADRVLGDVRSLGHNPIELIN